MKHDALEEQLTLAELQINVGNENQRRWIQEFEFVVRLQRDKIRQLTEELNRQLLLAKSERNKAKATEKLFPEIKQKKFLHRTFTLYEIL